tara:strand:+ start:1801 stop:2649 length:849 start_codon:yes stop_codon:yes gene_type:complete
MDRLYKKSTKEFYVLITLAIISIAISVLDYRLKKVDPIRYFINDVIVYPIYNLSSKPQSILSSVLKEYEDIEVLELKIKDLENENISLKIKLQELQALKEENIRLRDIQKKSKTSSKKQTIAKVLNSSASPNKKMIVIDKGQNDGLYKGQNVIGVNGLIGQIVELNMISSKVILINDKNHNVPGIINRTGEKVIIAGNTEDGQLKVEFAPVDTPIEVDDIVSTSGIAGRFKSKIPIGKVIFIEKDPEKKFSSISVEPFENLNNLSDVILIWDYKPSVEEKNE